MAEEIPGLDAEATVFLVAVGAAVRRHRLKRGWLLKDLAREAGLSTSALSRYELGQRAMNMTTLFRVCRALGLKPRALLGEVYGGSGFRLSVAWIDLAELARTTVARVRSLQPWARLSLAELGARRAEISFTADALDRMADQCGLSSDDLVRELLQAGIARLDDTSEGGDT